MNVPPPISVLMPVYNGERYLREAIESILSQTFTDFEFLIVNDGSTDLTGQIVREFSDPRIRLIDNPTNIGLQESLNIGLRLAKGAYIARQDADDISEPRRLERQYAFMEANRDVALLGCWYREIDSQGQVRARIRPSSDPTELRWALLFYCPFVHSGTMLRRTHFVHEISFYDETIRYGEDHDLWLRASRLKPLTNYPEYLVRYRLNPHSMSETYGEVTLEGTMVAVSAVASLLGWVDDHAEMNLGRFRKLFALMYGDLGGLEPSEVDALAATVRELHVAFCAEYKLERSVARRHETWLRAWLSRRYTRLAHRCVTEGLRSEALKLYISALRSAPNPLHRLRSFSLAGKLLLLELLRAPRARSGPA